MVNLQTSINRAHRRYAAALRVAHHPSLTRVSSTHDLEEAFAAVVTMVLHPCIVGVNLADCWSVVHNVTQRIHASSLNAMAWHAVTTLVPVWVEFVITCGRCGLSLSHSHGVFVDRARVAMLVTTPALMAGVLFGAEVLRLWHECSQAPAVRMAYEDVRM